LPDPCGWVLRMAKAGKGTLQTLPVPVEREAAFRLRRTVGIVALTGGGRAEELHHHHHRCERNGGQGAPPHASDPGYNQLLAMAGEKGCKWLAGDARSIPSGIDGVKAGGANAKRPIMKILDRNGEVR